MVTLVLELKPTQYTEVRFVSFLSGGFITAILVNPLERKLTKRTSVQCKKLRFDKVVSGKRYYFRDTKDFLVLSGDFHQSLTDKIRKPKKYFVITSDQNLSKLIFVQNLLCALCLLRFSS